MDFWKRVDAVVKEKGLSLSKLWKAARISPSTGNGWRVMDRYPDAQSLARLSKALDVSMEWLMGTDEADGLDGRPEAGEGGVFLSGRPGHVRQVVDDDDTVSVPVYAQKLSAGRGQMFNDEEDITGYIRVPRRMTSGVERQRLGAAEVKGDSMTGVQIYSGDLVIFALGAVDEGDGLYVVALGDSVLVKRVSFNPVEASVTIASENPKYAPITVASDDENVRICGKVLGWMHSNPM